MNAIILAAGEGKRLRPLTNKKPKGLVELFGKSILERQIEIFMNAGITDISIVTGFNANMIKFPKINYFHNPNFKTTNMIETLFCAKEKLNESTIISYGDIIFESTVLEKLIISKNKISIIIDLEWEKYWKKRFVDPLSDAESLKFNENNYITEIGQKVKKVEEIQGQFIGLMKFQNEGIRILKKFYNECKIISANSNNPLNSTIPFEKSYMTDLLQGLIKNGFLLKSIPISNRWLELDSIEDYKLYNKMFKNNTIDEFFSTMI